MKAHCFIFTEPRPGTLSTSLMYVVVVVVVVAKVASFIVARIHRVFLLLLLLFETTRAEFMPNAMNRVGSRRVDRHCVCCNNKKKKKELGVVVQ